MPKIAALNLITSRKIYCICIEEHSNSWDIEKGANELSIEILKISQSHLFINPNDGRCGFDDREKYVASIGNSIKSILNKVCEDLVSQMKQQPSTQMVLTI